MLKVRFEDLKVGDRFHCLNAEFIKIDDKIYDGPLSKRPANAVNLTNKHKVVFGDKVLVDKEISIYSEDVESLYPKIIITRDLGDERIEDIINHRFERVFGKIEILEEELRLLREYTIYGSYGQLKPIGDPGGGK